MSTPRFSKALLHPRYWPTWLGFGLLACLAQLPFSWQIGLGKQIGRLSYYLAKKRRAIALRNVELCFPEYTAEQQIALVKSHFETNGMTLLEIGMAWFMPYSRLKKRFVVKGQEHWQALQEQGKGALVISFHFNTLEITNVEINRLFTMSVSYRAHKNPVYDLIQHWGRQRQNPDCQVVHHKDIRGMVRVLKEGGLLWYAADHDYGRRVSEFVPWFGIATATVAATPRLLKMARVPAVALVNRRLPDYSGYEIEFKPVLEGLPSGDDYQDLVQLNNFIEQCVRDNAEEYLWVHRRFKTRPRGEPSLYK